MLLNAINGELSEMVSAPAFKSFWQLFHFILFTEMRFALMQAKNGRCHILSRFEVAPCKDTPVRTVFEPKSFLLQMLGEIRMSFNRMQFWNNTHTHTHIYIYISGGTRRYPGWEIAKADIWNHMEGQWLDRLDIICIIAIP
jgi:hypothetical protein